MSQLTETKIPWCIAGRQAQGFSLANVGDIGLRDHSKVGFPTSLDFTPTSKRETVMSKKLLLSLASCLFFASGILDAQPVDPSRGVDPTVDYEALKTVGPWDDRNYSLTAEDLKLLSANESEQRTPVPAFYRVELRRRFPDLPRTGQHQYPRSTLPHFRTKHGALLIDGQLYKSTSKTKAGFSVDLSKPWQSHQEWVDKRGVIGEIRLGPGAETAVAINPVDPQIVIAGANGGSGGQVMYYSSDGGTNWTSAGALPGACCDPTIGWSTDGTRAYTVTLGAANDVYLSTNNGQTWTLLDVVGSGFVDKEYLHVDGFATSPFIDHLYLTWHLNGVMKFSRSTDLGVSWSTPVDLSVGAAQTGIGSDITSDKNGHLYYIWPTFNGGMTWVRKSTDGGATFAPAVQIVDTVGSYEFPLPAMSQRRVFMYTSADSDLTGGTYANSLYVAYTDNTVPSDFGNPANNHGRIQVAYSRDGGATWTVTTPHETADSDTVDRFHPWLKVAPDGKVWVVFYDTRNGGDRTTVDFYYSVSDDGAQTWSAPERLTTVTSPKPNDGFEWGDYNGMDIVVDELIGIYTDNRNEGGGGGDSVDIYVVGTMTGMSTLVFGDGFEAGDTSAWTSAVP